MEMTKELIEAYKIHLYEEERSFSTIDKYIRDILSFYHSLEDHNITKEKLMLYKNSLLQKYKVSTINSMLISIHGFLDFIGLREYKVKLLKMQKNIFIDKDKELTKQEYQRLLTTAKNQKNDVESHIKLNNKINLN